MSPQPSLEQIKSKVAAVRKRQPVYGEVVAWMGQQLALALEAAPPSFAGASAPELPQVQQWPSGGRSLFSPGQMPVDLDLARDLLAKLQKNAAARPKSGREQAEGLGRLLQATPERLREFIAAFLASDLPAQARAAEELGLAPPALNLFLRLALRPSLLVVAQAALKDRELDKWTAGHCPVCGSAPRLASLAGEGGKRSLHCSLCETTWPYPRLQCPFCENQAADDLLVLTVEDQEGLRVDLCRRCGHYLKTLDLRSLAGPIIPILDDLVTWHLDLVAENHLEENPVASQAS